MSKETLEWLGQNVLVGNTAKRGNAWHYRAGNDNHYEGAIPLEDVRKRLFHWKAVEGTVETTVLAADGVTRITDTSRKAIVRPDTATILGIFSNGFQIHDYDEWLLVQAQNLADASLECGSAGLLKGGAVAWVQYELPETMQVEGVEFRPFLTAATSLDGSLASTFQTGSQIVVCDNTLSASLADKSHMVKIRHSRKSLGRISEVRDALGLVYSVADEFMAEVEALTAQTVTDKQWQKFLDEYAPEAPEAASKRAKSLAETKRDAMSTLYNTDLRASQWKGTAYGVLAAANTYETHYQNVRGMSRVERNALNMATGQHDKADALVLATLEKVLAS